LPFIDVSNTTLTVPAAALIPSNLHNDAVTTALITSTSVLGHFGPRSFRSLFKDQNDRGPKCPRTEVTDFGPWYRSVHQRTDQHITQQRLCLQSRTLRFLGYRS